MSREKSDLTMKDEFENIKSKFLQSTEDLTSLDVDFSMLPKNVDSNYDKFNYNTKSDERQPWSDVRNEEDGDKEHIDDGENIDEHDSTDEKLLISQDGHDFVASSKVDDYKF